MKNLSIFLIITTLTACATPEIKTTVITPGGDDSRVNRADTAYSQSNWESSETLYLELVQEYPDNGQYWYRLGNIYSTTNRLDAAIEAYKQSLGTDPANPSIWFNLGMTQLKQSAYTFNSMQSDKVPDSPLSLKAEKILNGILQLLEQE